MELAARTASPDPRPGWWSTAVSVLAGSIVAAFLTLVALVPLAILHVLPTSHDATAPGAGWPWRIHGAWSVAADAGPALGVGLLVAWAIRIYVRRRAGRDLALWPVATVAAIVGWLPVAGAGGLFPTSRLLAFAAIVAIVRFAPVPARRHRAWPAVAAAAVALAATTLAYAVAHPLIVSGESYATAGPVRLRAGEGVRVPLELANDAPVRVRVLDVSAESPDGAVLRRLEVPRGEGPAPTIAQLFRPIDGTSVAAGASYPVEALLGARRCAGPAVSVVALRVRFRALGIVRWQRVALARPLSVRCSGA